MRVMAVFSGLFLIAVRFKAQGIFQWEYRRRPGYDFAGSLGGLLVTAGGFAFTSNLAKLLALDAKTAVALLVHRNGRLYKCRTDNVPSRQPTIPYSRYR
jgi:hypothetical protein